MCHSKSQQVEVESPFMSPKELAQRWRCVRSSVDRIARRAGLTRTCPGEGRNGGGALRTIATRMNLAFHKLKHIQTALNPGIRPILDPLDRLDHHLDVLDGQRCSADIRDCLRTKTSRSWHRILGAQG
jgi:hypothetical protein